LNEYENHELATEYQDSLSQKFFIANFITNFVSLFLVGFVYIPCFPWFSKILKDHLKLQVTSKSILTHQRLREEVKYYVVTGQIINFCTEVVVPWVTRKATDGGKNVVNKIQGKKKEDTSAIVKTIMKQAQLPPYDIFEDYSELVTQVGVARSLFAHITTCIDAVWIYCDVLYDLALGTFGSFYQQLV
jgi:hypothetical protein